MPSTTPGLPGDLDGFVDFVAREVWSRFRTTMHPAGLIEIGDVAESESYAVCHHVIEEGGRDVADCDGNPVSRSDERGMGRGESRVERR